MEIFWGSLQVFLARKRPRQGARRWPVRKLAKELHEHAAMFDHETRQRIQEYCEPAKRLSNDNDAPLGGV